MALSVYKLCYRSAIPLSTQNTSCSGKCSLPMGEMLNVKSKSIPSLNEINTEIKAISLSLKLAAVSNHSANDKTVLSDTIESTDQDASTQKVLANRLSLLNYNASRRRSARYHYVDGKYVGPSRNGDSDASLAERKKVLFRESRAIQNRLRNSLTSLLHPDPDIAKHREALLAYRKLVSLKQEADALEDRRRLREAEEQHLEQEEKARLKLQLKQDRDQDGNEIDAKTKRIRLRKLRKLQERQRKRRNELEQEIGRNRLEEENQLLQCQRDLEKEEAESEKLLLFEMEDLLNRLRQLERNFEQSTRPKGGGRISTRSQKSTACSNVALHYSDPQRVFLSHETKKISEKFQQASQPEKLKSSPNQTDAQKDKMADEINHTASST